MQGEARGATLSETIRQPPPRLHFLVAPEASRLLRARDRVRDYLTQHCSEQAIIDDVVLAVEEACTNAIRHSGSQEEIEIFLGFEGNDLLAAVKDRGRGFDVETFDRKAVPDPLLDHGRGLFLISRLCDEMELSMDSGLEVRLAKKSVAFCEAPALETGLADISALPNLARRETRARALLEEIDEAFMAVDWEYRYVHVNEAMLHLAGKTRDELIGRRSWDLWPAAAETPAALAIREAMELGRPSVVEFRAVANGDWLEARIYPTPVGVCLYAREIGERKRIEEERERLFEELTRSEERARHLIRHAPAAIYEIDFRGPRFTSVNDFMCEYSGYSREELLAANPADLIAEEDRGVFLERQRKTLADEPTETALRYRFTTKQGEKRTAVLRASPTFDNGKPVGAFVVAHDVTESERAEEALRESEQRFRSLFESMAEGVALHELVYADGRAVDYRILDVNSSFEQQTGLVADDARGRLASKLYGTGEAPYLAEYARVAETGESCAFETYFPPMERHFRITAVSPGPSRFATVFEDITESKQTARLAETLAELDSLVHSSLEFDEIVQTALREGAAALGAETCGLSLHDDEARRFRVAYVHNYPPDKIGVLIPDEQDTHGVLAMRSGETLAIDDTGTAPRVVRSLMEAWTIKSVICAPLNVRGQALGVVYYNYHSATHHFSPREIDFLSRLALSVSTALENAQLYGAQQRIATTLQESFVHPLPSIAGLELAALSLPAGRNELIGGDFRDVIVRRDGKVVALIGDVTGKGIEAAGFTETVRAAVRTLALISPSPEYILGNVNRLLLHEGEHQQLATALLVVLDPANGHGLLASAGHPPVVHLAGPGCRIVQPRFGLPLGVLEQAYETAGFTLAPGESLVLYTDGLTEARRHGKVFGEKRLLEVLGAAHDEDPHELVRRLKDAVVTYAGELKDDLQILVLRRTA